MIVTLTGASCAGKGFIAGKLLERLPNSKLIPSHTTRGRESRDLPGEYIYVTPKEFKALKDANEFLWNISAHGNEYGTMRTFVDEALEREDIISIMFLVDVVDILIAYLKSKNKGNDILSYYILAKREVREERFIRRGDKPEDIERRLADCELWDQVALKSKIPYVFVENNTDIALPVDEIIKLVKDYQFGL